MRRACATFKRARVIYSYAQEQLPRERAPELFARFAAFEKKHGRRGDIEDVIISGRREHCMLPRDQLETPRAPLSPDLQCL